MAAVWGAQTLSWWGKEQTSAAYLFLGAVQIPIAASSQPTTASVHPTLESAPLPPAASQRKPEPAEQAAAGIGSLPGKGKGAKASRTPDGALPLPSKRIRRDEPEKATPRKTIPQAFNKNGYHYELERRSARVCIYRQIHRTGKLAAYEVMVIRLGRGRTIGGRTFGDYERLPQNEDWGTYGWTFSGPKALEQAVERFNSLQDAPALG
jgi:hypothetical protein